MTLKPDRYECPDHHTDLSGLVKQPLDEQGSPVAYRRDHPFQLNVTSPGKASSGAHLVTCTGTQTP